MTETEHEHFSVKFHRMLCEIDYLLTNRMTTYQSTIKYAHERRVNFITIAESTWLDENMPHNENGSAYTYAFESGRYQKLDLSFIESFVRKWIQSTMKLDFEVIHCGKRPDEGNHTIAITSIHTG